MAEALDRVEGDGTVGCERGDEGDVDALEQTACGHGREGTAAGERTGPEKHVVEHRLGEPAGERVLLARVVAPQHRDAAGRRHLDAVPELRAGRGQWGSARGEHPGQIAA